MKQRLNGHAAAISGVLATLLVAGAVAAANAHFIGSQTEATLDDECDLEVCFKIAGLGDTVTTTVTATAVATAVYACKNNGGNFPNDPKKQEVSGPVSEDGEFTSGKNGQITACLTLEPPPSTLDCPPGQTEVLCACTYQNVQVFEPNAGTESVPGTFSHIADPACITAIGGL